MEFRTDEPGGRSAHIDEVDLYDELAKFSSLSPEEQREQLGELNREITSMPSASQSTRSRSAGPTCRPSTPPPSITSASTALA